MITIFKKKEDIPQTMEYIELNDIFFNQNTVTVLDENAEKIIEEIDNSKMNGRYKIYSKFDGTIINIDKLSAGCKTVLNVFYYPEKVFCLKECGSNALSVLYKLQSGNVYSDYALIPMDITAVTVQTKADSKIIKDYEKLKEWWNNEK